MQAQQQQQGVYSEYASLLKQAFKYNILWLAEVYRRSKMLDDFEEEILSELEEKWEKWSEWSMQDKLCWQDYDEVNWSACLNKEMLWYMDKSTNWQEYREKWMNLWWWDEMCERYKGREVENLWEYARTYEEWLSLPDEKRQQQLRALRNEDLSN